MIAKDVGGTKADWSVFALEKTDGSKVIVRSRAANREVAEYARRNVCVRLRCLLPEEHVTPSGMPLQTQALDDYEDALIAGFQSKGLPAKLIAIVTGEGRRDLFFAVAKREDMVEVVESARAERPFKLQVGWVEGSCDLVLASLNPQQGG